MFLHSVSLWNLAFYAFMVVLATLGVWDVFFDFEENKCSMSYMFEYPEYQKIELPKKLTKRYPSYELYLYGEGSYADEHKALPLTGIPVLFLPGNAGSYKQVRSIGSIALRKAEDIDFKYHFDFFSVNFNEELVALYGGSLRKQTKFVHQCIKTILKLYKGQEFAPTSVTIVGHSMGGLVARALLTLKNFKQDLINLLVTQATPHVAPVMPLDRFITEFYMTVNDYWILNARNINLTTLSVAGGFRDYQVRSGLTFLPKLSHQTSALSVVVTISKVLYSTIVDTEERQKGNGVSTPVNGRQSSAVPKTWVSTDHLSIVWCKQLQLTTIRAFLDLIDADTKQITQKPKKKLSVLNHHFIRHPAKQFEENPSIISDFPGLTSRKVILNLSGLYYNIELLNFEQIYQAFKVNVVSKCSRSKAEEKTSIYKLHIPWSYEDSLTIAQVPSSTEISLKLHVAQPENDSHVALLKMYTVPDCKYEVVSFHGGAYPAYVVSSIMLAYGGQLSSLLTTGYCLEYATILDKEAKPYRVDPFVIMIKFLLGYRWFKDLWDGLFLPELEAIVLTSQSMCFPLVSLILFLLGTCTAYWSGLLSSASVQLLSSLWLALKGPVELPKDVRANASDLPFATSVFLIVSWTTCGALSILLSYLYYVFKVVHLQACLTTFRNSQQVNPKHSRRSEKKSNHHKDSPVQSLRLSVQDVEDSLRMHGTVINLLTWVVLLSLPSLIYWLKNLGYYFKLQPDPCKPLVFLLTPAVGILGNSYTLSVKSSKLLKSTSQFPLPLAVGFIAFGSTHLYRVPNFVVVPLLYHALCNFL
ncbi:GPI inositol-deacylase [Microtus ochrogaster]|uniref:GPI inositol-deacylase n=1 Tax=Microtus ochrogaster TaxID=79684 RepID=A0A8J6GI63_MICOH|nr:GPI inositol-deacylase [Microtus ochrogaster]